MHKPQPNLKVIAPSSTADSGNTFHPTKNCRLRHHHAYYSLLHYSHLRLHAIPLQQEVRAHLAKGVLLLPQGLQHAGLADAGELVADLSGEAHGAVREGQGVLPVLLVRGAPVDVMC